MSTSGRVWAFARTAGELQGRLDRTEADIELLESLSGECRRIAVPLDVAGVDIQLEGLRRLQALV